MLHMNGFELSERLLKIDINPKICFMSSGQINQQALSASNKKYSLFALTLNATSGCSLISIR